ncbi:MAG: alternative ribosome rescue aminoacyl-tRNA hydrolase ArfB [Planctomycetota bacterium]|nr:alternative ribosome rescue aminoacyl-tRNA hydrolase ArfB [Planctomycetota bacterium]
MAAEPLFVRPGVVIPAEELDVRFARSGGPGGQNVNKVETKVDLRFRPSASRALTEDQRARVLGRLGGRLTTEGELIVVSTTYRDRARNIEDARERLASELREALKTVKARRATKPTRGSDRRRLDSKRRRGDTKRHRRGDE